MPGLQPGGAAFQYELYYYNTTASSLPPGVWYDYTTRSDYLQTTEFANINFDITDRLNVEAGLVHFHSDFSYYSPYGQFAYQPVTSTLSVGSSHKWNSKFGINYRLTDHVMLYGDFAQGFRDGGTNALPPSCYVDANGNPNGVQHDYTPDTLNSFEVGWKTTSLGGRLLWNGAAYYMKWKDLQTLIYDVDLCPSSSFNANVGDARIYGVESNVDYKLNDNWSFQASASYTDSHLVSSTYATFQGNVGERLPYVPYFNYSWNLRYEHPLGGQLLGYAQLDMAHKGDMWNDLHVVGSNGFPRMLQPEYSLLNLRLGLNPENVRLAARGLRHQPRGQERDHLHQHRQLRPARDDQRAAGLRPADQLPLGQARGRTSSPLRRHPRQWHGNGAHARCGSPRLPAAPRRCSIGARA